MYKALAIVILLVLLGLFFFNLKPNQSTAINQKPENNISPTQTQASSDPKPEIEVKDVDGSKKRLEISEYQLAVTIPADWRYELLTGSRVYIYKDNVQTPYQGYLVIEGPDQNQISIIPNMQGGWCEGPNEPEKEILPDKFGLPATKFTCGSSFYVYGDLNKPGSVIPNLFVSVKNGSDPKIKEIISSISYTPTE